MKSRLPIRSIAVVLLCLSAAHSFGQAQYVLTELGVESHGRGMSVGLNNSAQVVGEPTGTLQFEEALVLEADVTLHHLGQIPGSTWFGSRAHDISNARFAVGGGSFSNFGQVAHAARWDKVGSSYQITDLHSAVAAVQPTAHSSDAQAINELQQIVGWYAIGAEDSAAIWDPSYGLVTLFDQLQDTQGWTLLYEAHDINESGQILVTGRDASAQIKLALLTPVSTIPEPSALILLGMAGLGFFVVRKRPRQFVFCPTPFPGSCQILLIALCLLPFSPSAQAQNAYWSLEGDFQNADDSVQLIFELLGSGTSSADTFYGATYGHSGGTNAAGDLISGGGFDPILSLYDVTGGGAVFRGENDDGWPDFPTDLDSFLSWPGIASQGGSINTDPLLAGDYRMDLTAYQPSYAGGTSAWAMDLVGPWGAPVMLNGLTPAGGATIRSLQFGSEPGGAAWFNLKEPSATITEEMVVGTSGFGNLSVNAETTLNTPGNTIIGGGGVGYLTTFGSNARWNAGTVAIGNPNGVGAGDVYVSESTYVTSGDVSVGSNSANGNILVRGFNFFGAEWDATGSLDVGSSGLGAGTITIEDYGLMTVSQDVRVFGSIDGSGTLSVQSDGEFTVGGQLDVGDGGTVELLGGDITTHSFVVDPQGTFTHEDGMLTVDGGQFKMESGVLTIDSGGGPGSPVLRLDNGALGFVEAPTGESSSGWLTVGMNNRGRMEIVGGSRMVNGLGVITGDRTGEGMVVVEGTDSTWEITADAGNGITWIDALSVGAAGAGTLEIREGGQVVVHGSSAEVGSSACCFGLVTTPGVAIVDGSDSLLKVENGPHAFSGQLRIGALSSSDGVSGILTVSNGGRVEADKSLDIHYHGSVLLTSDGEIHTGSFTIHPGGTFTHEDGTLTVDGGTFDPGVAIYRVEGAAPADLPVIRLEKGASASLVESVEIGDFHRGRLEIASGSHVDQPGTNTVFNIAHNSGSEGEVIVEGQGSRLTTNSGVLVGIHGNGVLRILGGGSVAADSSFTDIARFVGSVGLVEVTGTAPNGDPSMLLAPGDLTVGAGGHGTMVISDGGRVSSLADAFITWWAEGSGSSVTVVDMGSSWDVGGSLFVGGQPFVASGAGTLTVANEGQVVANHIKIWQPGIVQLDGGTISTDTMDVEGQLTGSGTIVLAAWQAVTNRGYVSPGLSPGVLTISGGSTGHNYVQEAAGILRIEIGGTSPAQYDRLHVVAGSATLGGFLDVALIDPNGGTNIFIPSEGDVFEILTASDGLGGTTFANKLLPALPGGLDWNVLYETNSVTLEVFLQSFLGGDFDEDGDVDGADFLAWQAGFGTQDGAEHSNGDANADGDIDGDDFLLWQSQFGSASGVGTSAAVPEPGAVWLALAATAFGGSLRRRHPHRRPKRAHVWA